MTSYLKTGVNSSFFSSVLKVRMGRGKSKQSIRNYDRYDEEIGKGPSEEMWNEWRMDLPISTNRGINVKCVPIDAEEMYSPSDFHLKVKYRSGKDNWDHLNLSCVQFRCLYRLIEDYFFRKTNGLEVVRERRLISQHDLLEIEIKHAKELSDLNAKHAKENAILANRCLKLEDQVNLITHMFTASKLYNSLCERDDCIESCKKWMK